MDTKEIYGPETFNGGVISNIGEHSYFFFDKDGRFKRRATRSEYENFSKKNTHIKKCISGNQFRYAIKSTTLNGLLLIQCGYRSTLEKIIDSHNKGKRLFNKKLECNPKNFDGQAQLYAMITDANHTHLKGVFYDPFYEEEINFSGELLINISEMKGLLHGKLKNPIKKILANRRRIIERQHILA
jgi:hypothetical protein